MKILKKLLYTVFALVMVLCLLPSAASADEEEYVYLSISFDGQYIDDQNGDAIVYLPVPMEAIRSIDLADYGLEHMYIDNDGDGVYETTALQLLIYAHENIYGGDWSEVNFDALPGSSYFAGGIFGFTENLVYFHNGDFPVDESQQSDFMTIGATSDRIVLRPGDFLDVASFSCYSFLWDTQGGFHFFADADGSFTHEYNVDPGQELSVHLLHSFCDLMYGEGWCVDAQYYDVYYGTVFGEPMGTVTTDDAGMAQFTIDEAGTYYVWCEGGHGDDYTHTACDAYFETGMPCIVSAPAYARIVVGSQEAVDQKFDVSYARMILGNALEFQFAVPQAATSDWTDTYAVIEKNWADGTTTTKTIPATEWGTATIDGEKYWAIVYDGLAAKEMADTFNVTVYNAQGEALSNTWTDSVRDYVLRSIGTQSAESDTMMVDMLCYGTAAQENFNYGTADLANSKLTPEQLAMGTSAEPELTNKLVRGKNYMGTRLILESRIQMQVAFKNLTSSMYAIYTYTNAKGEAKSVRVEGEDFVIIGGKPSGVELNALVYADARNMVEITVYNADNTVYGTVTDSIESYAKRTTDDQVCSALMKFADSAKAYLY